eukprot:759335-Hanusia_phi.AAC.5
MFSCREDECVANNVVRTEEGRARRMGEGEFKGRKEQEQVREQSGEKLTRRGRQLWRGKKTGERRREDEGR